MLIRISLIVAIIAGLAVGVLNFVQVKEKITTLVADRDNEKDQKTKALADLASTRSKLSKTETDLKQTQNELATVTEERTKAVAEAASSKQRADQLSEELGRTKTELGDVQAEVQRFRASGMSPEQVLAMSKTLRDAQQALGGAESENALLGKKIGQLQAKLEKYEGIDHTVYLKATLKGKILVSDPKWDFVVLDIGEDQGVLPEGELLVSRNGEMVAKVIVRSVQKDRSIANIIPGFKISEVMEGDQVVPANPASS